MIKVIIFDFGGVVAGTKSEESGLMGLCKKFANVLNLPVQDIYQVYKRQWNDWKLGRLTMDEVYDNFLSELDAISYKEKLVELTLAFSTRNEDVASLILRLKKNYKIVCLTNHAREWFESEVKRHNLNSLFEEIYTSYELGIDKPNPEVYKIVLKKLKIKPEESLFIDDLERNTKPAAELGIHTIVFHSYSQLKRELIKLRIKGV